jgi:hypothetical protein
MEEVAAAPTTLPTDFSSGESRSASASQEEELTDADPLIEAYRTKLREHEIYLKHLGKNKWGLYVAGTLVVLLASPPAFGAAWVVLDVYNFPMALAVIISLIVVLDRNVLTAYFFFPTLRKFAEYLASKRPEPLTPAQVLKELALYLAGAPSALFWAAFQFTMLIAFNATVQKYKETISPVFLALADVAMSLITQWVTAVPAFMMNFFGNLNVFKGAYATFFEVMEDWRNYSTYRGRNKVQFFMRNGLFISLFGVSIWGSTIFFSAAKDTFEKILSFPPGLSIPFAVAQVAFMCLIGFICSHILGKKTAQALVQCYGRDIKIQLEEDEGVILLEDGRSQLKSGDRIILSDAQIAIIPGAQEVQLKKGEWVSLTKSQVATNVVIGVVAGVLGTTATVQLVFAAVENQLGIGEQLGAAGVSFIFEYAALFGAGKLVEQGVKAVAAKCPSPKELWGRSMAFFKRNCPCAGNSNSDIVLESSTAKTVAFQGVMTL